MLSADSKTTMAQLQVLTNEIFRLSESDDKWKSHIEKAIELCDCMDAEELTNHDKKQLESVSVNLWNHAVTSRFNNELTALANALLRHLSFKIVRFCNKDTTDEITLRKINMMGLKSGRSWIDCKDTEKAEQILKLTMESNGKRHPFSLIVSIQENATRLKSLCLKKKNDCQMLPMAKDLDTQLIEIEKDVFKIFCYKAEVAFNQSENEVAFRVIQSAKDMLTTLPKESGFLSMLCYNFGVDLYEKKLFLFCISWLKLSYDIDKDKKISGTANQACTLRLLATAYLELGDAESVMNALNAINLANSNTRCVKKYKKSRYLFDTPCIFIIHNNPFGLFLRLKICLLNSEVDVVQIKTALEELNNHPELSVQLGLQSSQLLIKNERQELAMEQLKYLLSKFPNSTEYGKIVVAQIELILEMKQSQKAKDLIEEIITAHNMDQPLDLSTRKRMHYILWEQASIAFEKKDYSESLQWYDYSYNLFSLGEYADLNLAKLHRNRATCYINVNNFEKAKDAIIKAESYDPSSPHTQFILFKLALLQKESTLAAEALQKLCQLASYEKKDFIDPTVDTSSLICLAAQMAYEKGDKTIALVALEKYLERCNNPKIKLTTLRCLVRLLLADTERSSLPLSQLLTHLKAALNVLNEITSSQDANEVNKSNEATWFMKIVWNLAIQSENSPDFLKEFFSLCTQLAALCPSDLDSLGRQKSCSLIVAAACLQLASKSSDANEQTTLYKEALVHINTCRNACDKILTDQLISTRDDSKRDIAETLLVLYEFEARAKLNDPMLESVLEKALMMPNSNAKTFETIADLRGNENGRPKHIASQSEINKALAVDAPANHKNLSIRALKVALRKYCQSSVLDYPAISQNFHSLIELTLPHFVSSNDDQSLKDGHDEVFQYFQEAFDFIDKKAKDMYPEFEILWLMTKAWNLGIHFYSSGCHLKAERWCSLSMKFQHCLSALKTTYEQQMNAVYTEILSKIDSS